ncbi:MAG: uracil-DNA glycosylase [Planctomycetota bacterium]
MTTDPHTLVAQHARTASLLGVEFLPLGEASRVAPADAGMAHAGDEPDDTNVCDRGAQLEALRARHARESPILGHITGWTNIVFGDGSPDARLMFVGEAPGADEDAKGIPFVGRAGQLLNKMIIAMGLSRDEVYIANVLKVRPPNNRTPTPDEWAMDGPYLKDQVSIIQPEVIVTLGRPAAHYLLETTAAMGRLRGSWHDYAGVPVMPTYHPAYLLRAYTADNRQKVWSDLQQVMGRLGLGG